MQTKHTPGPWYIFTGTQCPGIESSTVPQSIVLYGDDEDEAGIKGCNKAEIEANAHLIAAAPELLEALDAFVAIFNRWDEAGNLTIFEENILSSGRKAINKATGQ